MTPVGESPCGPLRNVARVARTRVAASSRGTYPRSTPMHQALRPNPTAAMLHLESGVDRSLISPVTGSASDRKYSKAVRSIASSNWSSFRMIGGGSDSSGEASTRKGRAKHKTHTQRRLRRGIMGRRSRDPAGRVETKKEPPREERLFEFVGQPGLSRRGWTLPRRPARPAGLR